MSNNDNKLDAKLTTWYQRKKMERAVLNMFAETVGLKRKPGETNKQLRARIVKAIVMGRLSYRTAVFMEGGTDNACIH